MIDVGLRRWHTGGMELYQLKTFAAVADEGHLTRAAERLHASQPTVSAHVKALEEELETRLFIRTPKGMQLTEAGERLLQRAQAVLAAADELEREARALGDELVGDVSLGLNTDAEYLRIAPLLTSLGDAHPRITLQLRQSASTSVQGTVRTGGLDCGFIFGPPRHPDIHAVRLDTTQFYVAVPDVWRDRLDRGVEALADLTWIVDPSDNPLERIIQPFFAAHSFRPAKRLEVDGDEIIRVLVAAGKGVSLMRHDELIAVNRIGTVHAAPFDELSIDLHFVCRARRDQDPVMAAVMQHVQAVWREPDAERAAAPQLVGELAAKDG